MPKFRVKLQVTITTNNIVIEAEDREELGRKVDNINVGLLVGTQADTLHITYLGEVSRVMDTVEETFPEIPPERQIEPTTKKKKGKGE